MNTTPRRLRHAAALFGAASLAATALTVLLPGAARAQTAVTDPVGYLSIALPANSDTFVSIPFTRPAEFTGAVASVSGSTLTIGGTPGFTAGAFAPLATAEPAPSTGHKTYYVIVGPKNAALTPTLSVTTGSATVTASTATPEAVAGDTITVAGYTFTVVSVSGATLTIDRVYPGTPAGTTTSGLAATYDHSPSEGRFYTVSTNDAGSLTVNLNGDSLANVTAGTQVSVIPYWTLGTVFPAADAFGTTGTNSKSFVASTSLKNRGTIILFPDLAGTGTNLVSKDNYFFLNGAWRYVGTDGTASYDDVTLVPDAYFIVRNPSTAPTSLALIPTGSVLVNRYTVALNINANAAQDNILALNRPAAVTLNDSGLISSGAFKVSPTLKGRTDQLLVYDNSQISTNKVSSATYYFFNGAWRKVNFDSTLDFGTDTLTPGSGFIIRKSAGNPIPTPFWQNSRNYLN